MRPQIHGSTDLCPPSSPVFFSDFTLSSHNHRDLGFQFQFHITHSLGRTVSNSHSHSHLASHGHPATTHAQQSTALQDLEVLNIRFFSFISLGLSLSISALWSPSASHRHGGTATGAQHHLHLSHSPLGELHLKY